MKHFHTVLSIAFLLATAQVSSAEEPPVVSRIIFDTDMATDCDDAGALAVLHVLADNGECEILATVSSSLNPTAYEAISAINNYYQRPDLPIGTVKGQGVNEKSRFTDRLATSSSPFSRRGPTSRRPRHLPRNPWKKQPDQSVTVVTVGYLTNLRNLMLFPAVNGRASSGALT